MKYRQRRDWAQAEGKLGIGSFGRDDASLGGLASLMDPADFRLVVLPPDPLRDIISLNDDTARWCRDGPQDPELQQVFGNQQRTVADAIVFHSYPRDDEAGFTDCIGLYRSAIVEAVFGTVAWERDGRRMFSLATCKRAAFLAVTYSALAHSEWDIAGPFNVVLVLRNTLGAWLGDFDRTWRTPMFHEPLTCLEQDVVIRLELEGPLDAAVVADDLADRIENAFGTTHRRHLPLVDGS